MSLPLIKDKLGQKPLVSAEKYIAYLRRNGHQLPELSPRAYLSLAGGLTRKWVEDQHLSNTRVLSLECHLGKSRSLFWGLDHGAPSMAIVVEELSALGVKEFICLGIAGSLQNQHQPGSVILCDAALRDEGTSYHYLSPSREVSADLNLGTEVEAALTSAQLSYVRGTSWTTDSPYRETVQELEEFQQQGVLSVEMEAAALYAVAAAKGLKAVSVFIVSDVLTSADWQPQFHHRAVGQSYRQVLRCLISTAPSI